MRLLLARLHRRPSFSATAALPPFAVRADDAVVPCPRCQLVYVGEREAADLAQRDTLLLKVRQRLAAECPDHPHRFRVTVSGG